MSVARDVLVVVGAGDLGRSIAAELGPGRTTVLADADPDTLEVAGLELADQGILLLAWRPLATRDDKDGPGVGVQCSRRCGLGHLGAWFQVSDRRSSARRQRTRRRRPYDRGHYRQGALLLRQGRDHPVSSAAPENPGQLGGEQAADPGVDPDALAGVLPDQNVPSW